MTLNRIFETGQLVANLTSKETKQLARIYAVSESRGFQTSYKPKRFFYFVPFSKNGLALTYRGITRDARRKQIPRYSDVTVIEPKLWSDFMS